MPKKGKNKNKQKGGSKNKLNVSGRGDEEYEIQGIILGDSYQNHRFQPLTLEQPKAMLPLLGTPMINYSIDLLVNAGINQIFIVCSSHSSILEEYLQTTKWFNKRYFPTLKIEIEKASDCHTVGDALRHIQRRELIQSNPFVLIHGDIVANISLSKLIEKQRQRYKQNSDNIMSCIFKRVSSKQRSMYVCFVCYSFFFLFFFFVLFSSVLFSFVGIILAQNKNRIKQNKIKIKYNKIQ